LGRYMVIETKAPEGYIGSDIRRSLDINGERAVRTIVVPNRRNAGTSSDTDFDDEEMRRNWGMLLEMIMDVGVPNAGAASRNVGDAPQ
ncbi:MAG: prealbumin-like fold domain-containing protein, partial [Clostridia bacterium]|nr:prealbumin-like fold domain-containing protein [Clostridia bacterium]